jgi:hypothetical protein
MLRRAHPVDAAVVCRALDRAQGVQADVEGRQASGERGTGTGTRPTRGVPQIPRVVGPVEYGVWPDLGAVGLAEQDGPRRLEPGGDGTILRRDVVCQAW